MREPSGRARRWRLVRARRDAVPESVRRAQVDREWPRTVVIRVTERTAVAAVPRDDGFLLVDRTGVAYTTVAVRPAELAVVRLAEPAPGDESTRAALAVLAVLTGELRQRLVLLTADAPTRIRLELSGGRTVIWGDASNGEAKARVATALLARPGKVIDVSAPDVVTVR